MKKPTIKNPFEKSRAVTLGYERDLRKVAREVGRIIGAFQDKKKGTIIGGLAGVNTIQGHLDDYARILRPWALLKGREMAQQAENADVRAWSSAAREMSLGLRQLLKRTNIGQTVREIMDSQVSLIQSIPIEAGRRVHKLVLTGMEDSRRADEVAEQIMRSQDVSESHAMLIARTETTRAATTLTEARSLSIGAETYTWRTARDSNVRPLHKQLEGTTHRWDNPPIAGEKGETANPGCIYNCRCYPEPNIPDRFFR